MTLTAPELDYISVEGFKSIASAKVELRPINVIIGPNGSGKSNFICNMEQLYIRLCHTSTD